MKAAINLALCSPQIPSLLHRYPHLLNVKFHGHLTPTS